MQKQTGIYKITIKDKIYIGSSVNIYQRWASHKSTLKNKKHHSPILQNYYNKYGIDIFCFSILEICSEDELLIKEQYYINNLDCKLNSCLIVGKPPKKTKEQVKQQSDNLRVLLSKKVYQYNLDGNFIKEFFNCKEVFELTGISKSGVNKCCLKYFRSFGGYQWSFEKLQKIDKYIFTEEIPVFLFNLKGELIQEFSSRKKCAHYLSCKINNVVTAIKNKYKINELYYVSNNNSFIIHTEIIHLYDKNFNYINSYTRDELIKIFKMKSNAIARHLNSAKHKTYCKYYLRYERIDKI